MFQVWYIKNVLNYISKTGLRNIAHDIRQYITNKNNGIVLQWKRLLLPSDHSKELRDQYIENSLHCIATIWLEMLIVHFQIDTYHMYIIRYLLCISYTHSDLRHSSESMSHNQIYAIQHAILVLSQQKLNWRTLCFFALLMFLCWKYYHLFIRVFFCSFNVYTGKCHAYYTL